MQLKTGEIEGWLRKPDPRIGAVLVYGPDRGLVSERARAFAERCGVPLDDPFSAVRFEAAEIEADPGRLAVELSTIAMFSDRRLVWVRAASTQKALPEAFQAVEAGDATALLLVEAGDLKKGTALRAAAENGARAIAIPCYADDARALDTLIDTAFA
ncbi:MAG: DNA polymerase III subunit delta, partial [Rhizobiaceae bacterium]